MNKKLIGILFLTAATIGIPGCSFANLKTASLSSVYCAAAIVSLLLLIGCCTSLKKKKGWFVLLFSSVFVVNVGYTLLSVSASLETALWANRVSYLGSVFLPFAMLMIILDVTSTEYPKILRLVSGILALAVFLVAASPGILPIYYKEVSFVTANGISALEKVYGPLHPIYLVYLLGYFSAMVAVIVRASVKKTIGSTSHAVVIAIAVFVNIGVWFIEQISDIGFEFLSISYIISELFLLGVHLVANENHHLREQIKQKEEALIATKTEKAVRVNDISPEQTEIFAQGIKALTPTEKAVCKAYIEGKTTKEIMAELNIKENTLKFHNKNLYGKLGVSSRKQLISVYSAIKISDGFKDMYPDVEFINADDSKKTKS